MNADLYNDLAEKAKDHAIREGLSDEWAYGFLNTMWPTIEGAITATPETGHEPDENGRTEDPLDG